MLNKRTLTKTLTYKVISWIIGILVVGWISGSFVMAAGATGAMVAANTIVYYFHELLWSKTEWGR